jgi:hypothetical protein
MIRETPSAPSTEDLITLIAALRAENESLMARIAELERQLGFTGDFPGDAESVPLPRRRVPEARNVAEFPCPTAIMGSGPRRAGILEPRDSSL